jgi:hypothetical protein
MNDHWNVLYQVSICYADRKSKMAAIAGHRLTLDPVGKCSNAFFSETTNMIKAKLYMNVLYNLKVCWSDMKFKIAATAGLSLTLDPMGNMFQNASSLKPLEQLKPNCTGMIIMYMYCHLKLFVKYYFKNQSFVLCLTYYRSCDDVDVIYDSNWYKGSQ